MDIDPVINVQVNGYWPHTLYFEKDFCDRSNWSSQLKKKTVTIHKI